MEKNPISLILFDKQFYKFLTVGFTNFCISYGVFLSIMSFLSKSRLTLSVAQTFSYLAGMCWSFFWNKRWSFSDESSDHMKQFIRFTISQLSLLVLSVILINFFVLWMNLGKSMGWFFAMGIITIANFLILKVWVFAKNG